MPPRYGKAMLGIRDPGPMAYAVRTGVGADSQLLGDFLLVKI